MQELPDLRCNAACRLTDLADHGLDAVHDTHDQILAPVKSLGCQPRDMLLHLGEAILHRAEHITHRILHSGSQYIFFFIFHLFAPLFFYNFKKQSSRIYGFLSCQIHSSIQSPQTLHGAKAMQRIIIVSPSSTLFFINLNLHNSCGVLILYPHLFHHTSRE